MNRKDFLNKIKNAGIVLEAESPDYWRLSNTKEVKDDEFYFNLNIKVEWRTGGTSGGSCWDNDHHYSVVGDDEPEFKSLDKILEVICPNISFLKYKRLMSDLIKTAERSVNEYYGNSSEYKSKQINVGELYEYLLKHNLFE